MDYMLMPLQRYADFSGRSRRMEYWMFFLFVIIVAVVIGLIEGALGMSGTIGGVYGPITAIFALALIIPGIAVQVRRFHDQGRSGWFVLLNFIPILVGLIVLVFMLIEGQKGSNEYGPDPKAAIEG